MDLGDRLGSWLSGQAYSLPDVVLELADQALDLLAGLLLRLQLLPEFLDQIGQCSRFGCSHALAVPAVGVRHEGGRRRPERCPGGGVTPVGDCQAHVRVRRSGKVTGHQPFTRPSLGLCSWAALLACLVLEARTAPASWIPGSWAIFSSTAANPGWRRSL